jgi:hypothetical protein
MKPFEWSLAGDLTIMREAKASFRSKRRSRRAGKPRMVLDGDRIVSPFSRDGPISFRTGVMQLSEAIWAVREKLMEHRVSRRADLWSTILKQVAEQDSFDGRHADTILDLIRSYLARLADQTSIALWRATEAGLADDTEDDCLFPDSIRMDLEMELLKGAQLRPLHELRLACTSPKMPTSSSDRSESEPR